METLLSFAFDNISSKELPKISKGLRQIRGVLETICFRSKSGDSAPEPRSAPSLAALESDPAFREFFRLQERFEWNVATRLVSSLDRLLGMCASDTSDRLIYSALDLLQGCLILHPPSRSIFERELYMNLLIDLLDPVANPLHTQATAISTLVCALLHRPRNIRVFEQVDGLRAISQLLNHVQGQLKASPQVQPLIPIFSPGVREDAPAGAAVTPADVRARLLEFIAFYLDDEPKPESSSLSTAEEHRHRRSSSVQASPSPHPGLGSADKQVRSSTQKRRLLARQLACIKVDDCISPVLSPATPTSTDDEGGVSRGFWRRKFAPSISSSSSSSSLSSSVTAAASAAAPKDTTPKGDNSNSNSNNSTLNNHSDDSGFAGSGSSWGSKRSTDDADTSATLVAEPTKFGVPAAGVVNLAKPKRVNVAGGAVLEVLEGEIRRMGLALACADA